MCIYIYYLHFLQNSQLHLVFFGLVRLLCVCFVLKVTKGKNKLRVMETMVRLAAEASPPIDLLEKDELVLHMSAMYKV